MKMMHELDHWSSTHPSWMVIGRVALGIGLHLKGIMFLSDSAQLENILNESILSSMTSWLSLVITWVHLLGGVLIIVGLLTRFATLLQIPILIGAVIFNFSRGIFTSGFELVLALVMLLLVIFFFVEGGGEISMDEYLKKHLL